MIFGYFTLIVALIISAIAAYYSIVGLTAIFAAAVIPIIIMGAALEVGKVTAAVWLKINWERASWVYKFYLVPAVAFLMILTSMGIFGFLSKAHSDQSLIGGDVQSKIAIYDEKIKTAKENIEADRKQLKQMDEAVDQVMARSSTEEGATKSNAIRRAQARDRTALAKNIESNQKLIGVLNDEAAPIRAEIRKVEAEVGPIKYIAALVYGDNPDANLLEAAVRWMIILIVAVFDPLALVLIIAAQQSIRWSKEDAIIINEDPKYEQDDGALTDDQLDQVKNSVKDNTEETLDTPVIPNPIDDKPEILTENIAPVDNKKKKIRKAKNEFLDTPIETKTSKERIVDIQTDNVTEEAQIKVPPYKEVSEGYVNFEGKLTSVEALKGMRPDLFLYTNNTNKPITSSFGTTFPKVSAKGDIFIRVDALPNRVFKFDGIRWIEINKETTDSYLHDQQYIKHLVTETAEGKYDPEMLSEVEIQKIEEYLNTKS
jgi:hypothetical protein